MERIACDEGIFWQDYETFYEDGIQMEPFSLNKEREEGYFDANMNYVEYVKEKELKVMIANYVLLIMYFLSKRWSRIRIKGWFTKSFVMYLTSNVLGTRK